MDHMVQSQDDPDHMGSSLRSKWPIPYLSPEMWEQLDFQTPHWQPVQQQMPILPGMK